MPFERISKVMETLDGAFVYAEADLAKSEFRVICSRCPNLKNVPRRSHAGAILAASYHSEHDPSEAHVPTADDPPPPWRR